jgi:hypothetical protein
VYIPQILARGLTPVDWSGYLGQQRRWARSVLDIKFRLYPGLAARLPLHQRLIGYVHGLYWIQGLSPLIGIAVLSAMLISGRVPSLVAPPLMPRLVGLLAAIGLTAAYRQRFYVGGLEERGLHWRAMVLEWAKWPWMLAAIGDLARRGARPYVVTPKTASTSRRNVLLIPHGLATSVVVVAWLLGRLGQPQRAWGLDVLASILVVLSVGLIATGYYRFPSPYDPKLAEREI